MIYNISLPVIAGWSMDRALISYLLPVWLLVVYFIYRRLDAKNKPVTVRFFWIQVLVSAIPVFVLSDPFRRIFFQNAVSPEELFKIVSVLNWLTLLYYLVQLIYAILLLRKLVKA